MSGTINTKKALITSLKILIAVASYGFVAYKVYNSPDINQFKLFFNGLDLKQWYILLIITGLMFVNWGLEAIKWKTLIHPIQKLSFYKSLFAVWTGVSIGNITPNRIGEFAGRILFLKKENRSKGASITLYGDLAQFIVTLVFGIAGFSLLSKYYLLDQSEISNTNLLIYIAGLSLCLLCSIIYFRIEKILGYLKGIKFLQKPIRKLSFENRIGAKIKIQTLYLSILRYITFTFQFYLALKFFEIDISYYHAILSISSIYLATHVIPNIPFAEIGIRVSFSLLFLALFTDSNASILFSSLLIYIINIAFPSIFGGIHLLSIRKRN